VPSASLLTSSRGTVLNDAGFLALNAWSSFLPAAGTRL
jgi:hypothetical protein